MGDVTLKSKGMGIDLLQCEFVSFWQGSTEFEIVTYVLQNYFKYGSLGKTVTHACALA